MKNNLGGAHIVTGETQIEDMQARHVLEKQFVQPLSDSTTPDVRNRRIFEAGNTAPVTITDFLNGSPGQRIYILGDGFTTIQNGTLIFTSTGANKLLAANIVYTFTFFETNGPPKSHIWVEDCCGGGGGGGASFEFISTGILTDEVTVNPRPTANTDMPNLSLIIPASGSDRTFIVNGHVFATLNATAADNIRTELHLDSTVIFTGGRGALNRLWFVLARTNETQGTSLMLPGVPIVIPGDGLSHTIAWKYNAVGTTLGMTFVNRFLCAFRVL